MNRIPEQRTRRIAARIAAIAVITLAPLALTAGPALADPAGAAPISDFGNDDSYGNSFGSDSDFGWDDNGQYGLRDHNRQNYDGWDDQFNNGHDNHRNQDSHAGYRNSGDYDAPVNWDHEDRSGGSDIPQNWNMPNPHIPPAPAGLLPQVHLPGMPLVAFPGLPGTGSAG